MIKNGFELADPDDGPTRSDMTVEQQLRRLNRITYALWTIGRPLIGSTLPVAISVSPDQESTQINMHVHAPAELAEVQQLIERLGWDPEQNRVRVGMSHHHRWYGMLAGYRAYAVWLEQPTVVDTQGRDPLPAGVGTGDRQADAQEIARAASGFGSTGPGQ